MAALETIVKYVRHLTGLLLIAGIIALGTASGLPNPAWAQLALQPADKHSTLPDKNLNYIRDDEFAQLMHDNLIKGENSFVKDAKFLFQECYGGGMLDDLKTAFGSQVSWVGGSASRYDQLSGGQISTLEKTKETNIDSIYVANPPQDYWTKALVPELGKTQTLLQSINNARDKDQIGAKGFIGHFEDGQSIATNNGENLTLHDTSATSHYALLWAGYADHLRHYSDIDNLRQALQTAWQGTNYQINILYGDGLHQTAKGQYDTVALPASWNQGQVSTQEGTLANLKTTVSNIAQNLGTDADFFFFATNHGGVLTEVPTTSAPVLPENHAVETFTLTQGELLGMQFEQPGPGGLNPDSPILTIGYDNPDDGLMNAVVSINGHLLGSLDPDATETQFGIPVNFLSLNNEIDIFNMGLSSITLGDQFFYTGNIDSNPAPVPVPPACVLLASGLVGLLAGGRGLKVLIVQPRG